MNKAILEAQARKLRNELEELRETKTLELVDLLNNHKESSIVYDWYEGTDLDLNMEILQYFIVSRVEIEGLEMATGETINPPEPKHFAGYLRYDVISKHRVVKIITENKTFNLRRP